MKLRLLASILSVLAFSAQAAAPGQYSVTSLGSLVGLDMNNHGQVAGYTVASGSQQAAIYNGGVVSAIAGTTGISFANGINDAGQISGNFGDSADRGFLYSSGSLTAIAGFEAYGIDNQGNVAGILTHAGPFGIYTTTSSLYANGQTTDVSLGGQFMRTIGISKGGTMYGFGNPPDSGAMNPFTYRNGVLTNYSNVFGESALVAAANDHNQLLGTDVASLSHFIYSNGVVEYLPSGVGYDSINNSGWAVGGLQDMTDYSFLKGLLLVDGVSYDLNSLIDPASGWNITSASVINENNQILAQGCNASGCGSLLLSPLAVGSPAASPLAGPVAAVPEPETYGMMLLGMAAIGVAARRRRKQAAE